jgi:hypothetical protein
MESSSDVPYGMAPGDSVLQNQLLPLQKKKTKNYPSVSELLFPIAHRGRDERAAQASAVLPIRASESPDQAEAFPDGVIFFDDLRPLVFTLDHGASLLTLLLGVLDVLGLRFPYSSPSHGERRRGPALEVEALDGGLGGIARALQVSWGITRLDELWTLGFPPLVSGLDGMSSPPPSPPLSNPVS